MKGPIVTCGLICFNPVEIILKIARSGSRVKYRISLEMSQGWQRIKSRKWRILSLDKINVDANFLSNEIKGYQNAQKTS